MSIDERTDASDYRSPAWWPACATASRAGAPARSSGASASSTACSGCSTRAAPNSCAAMQEDFGKPEVEAHATDIAFTITEVKHIRKNVASWVGAPQGQAAPQGPAGQGHRSSPSRSASRWSSPRGTTRCSCWSPRWPRRSPPATPSSPSRPSWPPPPPACSPSCCAPTSTPRPWPSSRAASTCPPRLLEQRFDHIFFTGSTAVGKVVARAAAEHLTPTVLELGGKSPAIVLPERRPRRHRPPHRRGASSSTPARPASPPTTCWSTATRKDELVDAARRRHRRVLRRRSHHVGRLHPDRQRPPRRAASRSCSPTTAARVVCGGTVDAATRKLAPTVIVDPDPDSALMQEEIFGPVLPIIAVDDVEEAIAFVNGRRQAARPLRLHRGRPTRPRSSSTGPRRVACASTTPSSTSPRPTCPSAASATSGQGRYHGKSGFEAVLEPEAGAAPSRPSPTISLMYPPYTKLKSKVLKNLV